MPKPEKKGPKKPGLNETITRPKLSQTTGGQKPKLSETTGTNKTNPSSPETAASNGPRDSTPLTHDRLQKIINDPNTLNDYKVIAQKPFTSLDPVQDGIFLTGAFGLFIENLKKCKILNKAEAKANKMTPSLIVNCTKELPNLKGYKTLRIPIDDDRKTNIYPYLIPTAKQMHQIIRCHGRVVVHCTAGVSRSATVCMAYLMSERKYTLRHAYKIVVKARSVSRPNNSFIQQLLKLEKEIFNFNSTTLVRYKKGGVVVDVLDFLRTDHPQLFEKEFSEAHEMNVVKDTDPPNGVVVDLDAPEHPPEPPSSPPQAQSSPDPSVTQDSTTSNSNAASVTSTQTTTSSTPNNSPDQKTSDVKRSSSEESL